MSKRKPLDAVATVRAQRESAAARDVAAAQQALRAEQARAEELQRYLQEYEAAPAQVSVQWLANRARFLDRLQEAVRAQQLRLRQAEASVEASRTRHMLARQDREVLARLQASYERADAREAQQRDQSALDDWASCRHGGAAA